MSKLESSIEFHYTKVPIKDNHEKRTEKLEIPSTYGYGTRHVQLIMFFFCLTVSFIARGHLGVTMVAMTSQLNVLHNNTNENTTFGDNSNATKKYTAGNGQSIDEDAWNVFRMYNWLKPVQEMVLTSFFLGYCIMTVPASLICQKWGGKVPIQISMFVQGILSVLTPWLAMWGGWKAVCVCRVVQGMSQSGTFPGIQTLLAQWVPESERATLSSYVYTGITAGTVLGFQISGITSAKFGWPVTFWIIGVLCLLCGACLTVLGASSPREHKNISEEEKLYIIGKIELQPVKRKSAPWRAILTSKPVWASFAAIVGSGVSFTFILIQVPSYIHYIFGVDVQNSGLLSSLPYVVSFSTSFFFGVISDFFTNRNIVSIKNARRISNTISQVGLAASLVCTSYASSTTVAVICLVLAMFFQMGINTGWLVNHIDLSPNYSGTLMACGTMIMNIFILGLPLLVSNIVTDMKNPYQWRIMIFLMAGLAFIGNLVFVSFMSADVQPWNECENEADELDLKSSKEKTNEESYK